MCQLLGMSCKQPASIGFSFEGFRARGGLTDDHKDGWGLAFYRNQQAQVFLDESPAAESPLAESIQKTDIKSNTIIAHIRKATVGAVKPRNCHPFQRNLWQQDWLFCHNGDLKGFNPPLDDEFQPEGDTDSELAFCFLLQELKRHFPYGADSIDDLFQWLNHLSEIIAAFGTFNIILSNGEWMYTYCSTHLAYVQRQYPFTRVTLIDRELSLDLSQHNNHDDQMVVIATKPLTANEQWTLYQPGEARLFKQGEVYKESKIGNVKK
ncbi:class II glutamine amidotransferase [Cellvibrio sp. UBA7661]|uniref:class II glutamine amidotransferase n=1 Tax=Cellvibrio sp. UBA7661 TaxID=1946311 RepID=UPI002F35F0D1